MEAGLLAEAVVDLPDGLDAVEEQGDAASPARPLKKARGADAAVAAAAPAVVPKAAAGVAKAPGGVAKAPGGVPKAPGVAKAKGKAKAQGKAKAPAVMPKVGARVLGCSKCRHSAAGCLQCRKPGYRPKS